MTVESTELVTLEGQPTTLFGTDDPLEVVQRASRMAVALGDVISRRKLYVQIDRDRAHVTVEGWTLCGSMLGVFADIEWTRPLPNGWEARAVAHLLDGRRLGAVDAQCTREEARWRRADDYAVRSMAQTRAISKCLRGPLGFIIELAGYAATPAEEIPLPSAPPGRSSGATNADLREEIEAAALVRGISRAQLTEIARVAGVSGKATAKQLRAILAAVEQYPMHEETTTDEDDHGDDAPEEGYGG